MTATPSWSLQGHSRMSDEQRRLLNAACEYHPDTGLFTWRSNGRGQTKRAGAIAGSAHSGGYTRIKIDGVTYFAHRLAVLFMTGRWPSEEVDHINGIRSDNRWENLRCATVAQNRRNNRGYPSRRKSRFKGVVREHRSKRWLAQIMTDGVNHRIGLFGSEEEASAAYKKEAVARHGEFAKW